MANVIKHGSVTEPFFRDGWRLTEYSGNPLGHQYGMPFRQLTRHPIMTSGDGIKMRDPHKCMERISSTESVFEQRLEELIEQDQISPFDGTES